jgi:hypothetical protein
MDGLLRGASQKRFATCKLISFCRPPCASQNRKRQEARSAADSDQPLPVRDGWPLKRPWVGLSWGEAIPDPTFRGRGRLQYAGRVALLLEHAHPSWILDGLLRVACKTGPPVWQNGWPARRSERKRTCGWQNELVLQATLRPVKTGSDKKPRLAGGRGFAGPPFAARASTIRRNTPSFLAVLHQRACS